MDMTTIKNLCKERKISMSALEKETGIGRRSIYNWERNSPSIDKVVAVADYFNVSVDQLLGRTVPHSSDTPAQGLARPTIDTQLLKLAHQLNEEGQSRLLDYAEDLVAGGRFPLVADKAAS